MKLSTRVARNTVIQIISKAISTALGLAAVAMMARYLGQAGFGQYTTIITFISFFAIVADLGLTLITVQMISRPNIDEGKILSNLFTLRFVSATAFLGLAPLLVLFFPYDPVVKIGVAISVLPFLFIALNQVLVGLFQKNLRMDKVSISEVASRLVLLSGVAAAVYFNFGLLGIIIATVFSGGVNFLMHFLFSSQFIKISWRIDLEIWRDIIVRSWPIALTIALNLIYLKADTLILSLIKSQAEVGIYGAAYNVINVLVTLPFMFAGLVLPIMTDVWARGLQREFNSVLQKSFDVMAIITLPMVVGTFFLAERIMVLVAGSEFAVSGEALKILIFAAAAIFLGNSFTHAVIAIDKQKKIIGVYFFTSITALAGYLYFIPTYSYFGAAGVTIYSELVVAAASFYLVAKYARFCLDVKVFAKSLAAACLMGCVIYYSAGINLALIILIAAIFYFIVLYFLKGLNFISLREVLSLNK